MEQLTPGELQRFREISIHGMLGISNHGRRIGIPCPFHNGTSYTAFYLYPDNSFHCYKCGAHGNNAIEFQRLLMRKERFDLEIIVNLLPYL